jgi:hypothetical protein
MQYAVRVDEIERVIREIEALRVGDAGSGPQMK